MELLKNKKLAIVSLIIVVIVFSLFNAHIQLNSNANKIEDEFYNGDRNDGLSIYNDLRSINTKALDLVNVANKYNYDASELQSLTSSFSSISSIADYSNYYKDIKKIYMAKANELLNLELSKDHKKIVNDAITEYKSCQNTIDYDPYNTYVYEYNKDTSTFISELIKKLSLTKEVTPFG